LNQQFLKVEVTFLQKLAKALWLFGDLTLFKKETFLLKQLFNTHRILNFEVKSAFCHLKVQTNGHYI